MTTELEKTQDEAQERVAVSSTRLLGCDHEPNTKCDRCGLDVDRYGNTEDDFRNCSFPDCGCDGARLCMAKNGASENATIANIEGMYQRTDYEAKCAKAALLWICAHDGKQPNVCMSHGGHK